MSASSRIAFVGLGAMGLPMAANLIRAGFTVSGYDLNPAALDALEAAGGLRAESVQAAAREADVLVLMVVNADQVEDVLFGAGNAAAALHTGAVVVISSTVMPAYARSAAARLAARGLLTVDAPVSGGVVGAQAASLSVMASGTPEAVALARPVLDAVGGNVFILGDEVGAGSTVKVVNQLLCGVHLAATAEALALGVRAGVDPHKLLEVIGSSAGSSWMFQNRGPRMVEGAFEPPLSAVDIFVKDLGIVLDTGRQNKFPLPLTAAALQVFLMASAAGFGRLDDSAVVKVFEQLAGIQVSA